MFTHDQVWHGIDRLARERGLSASGLARRAGLDPTTFNPSKRVTKQRKPRWPSTESLAKILNATETSLDTFVALMSDRPVSEVVAGAQAVRAALHDWGYRHANAFMSVSTLSLPVSPSLKLTDQGLVDVDRRAWADAVHSHA